ncbi:hypothetical protein [Hyphomonas sp.]|uniref:hypothetical protein n=1 Tax=Hyphomonas sp. TaxID=87 RepID=UPI000A968325|nr:hypothetical protein [Hyphomonas sp.]
MTAKISARNLVKEGWQQGLAALGPNLRWLGLFALAGGLYSASLRLDGNIAAPFAMAIATFGAGIQLSRGLYRSLIGPRPGGFLALSHANLAVYLAFLFFGFFIGFFLLILPGILIEAQGMYQLGADAAPELVQQAFLEMLPTPYGVFYLIVAAAGFAVLAYFALRLTLYGAATIDRGKAHVFQTFPWTKAHLKPLAAAALATHAAPFAAGLAANAALRTVLPDTAIGHAIEGAAGILLFAPFLLAGHGMAAAAYRRMRPEAAGPPAVSG